MVRRSLLVILICGMVGAGSAMALLSKRIPAGDDDSLLDSATLGELARLASSVGVPHNSPHIKQMLHLGSLKKRLDPAAFDGVFQDLRDQAMGGFNASMTGITAAYEAGIAGITACATAHGFHEGVALHTAYTSAKAAYDAAVTSHGDADSACATAKTECSSRDTKGTALHNAIANGGYCGGAAPTVFDLTSFPLKDVGTWAADLTNKYANWQAAASSCASNEATCSKKQTEKTQAELAKQQKCMELQTAATTGKSAYDNCYDVAKGELDGYDVVAAVKAEKRSIEQLEKLLCIVKTAAKSHGDKPNTDGTISCTDVDDGTGGVPHLNDYRCVCTSASASPPEIYSHDHDTRLDLLTEPSRDTAWDTKGCPDAWTTTTTTTTGVFKQRCAHDAGWTYILDYSDDRTVDDIPNTREAVAPGFDHANAFYIGNDALDKLDIQEAEMCALASSADCNWSCYPITDGAFNNDAHSCAPLGRFSTNTKKIIAALSGQCTVPFMNHPDGIASFQGSHSNKKWSCGGYKRVYGNIGYWHAEGWGLTMYGTRTTGEEFGWYSGHCGYSGLDVDTFQIRIKTR